MLQYESGIATYLLQYKLGINISWLTPSTITPALFEIKSWPLPYLVSVIESLYNFYVTKHVADFCMISFYGFMFSSERLVTDDDDWKFLRYAITTNT